ncbi:ATP-grasp domain-containing protein [Alteromonas halophila]|nr:hypothetical protein [Alteromonas halophila]
MKRTEDGKYRVLISNCTPFTSLLTQDKTIARHSETVVLGHHKRVRFPKGAAVNMFNLVSDADSSMLSLRQIETICERNGFKRVFNHPRNIQLTSRANARRVFSDIPGLVIPKTVATTFSSIPNLARDITAHKLSYPLIIRCSGRHGGEAMYRVDSEEALSELPDDLKQEGTRLLLIEYLAREDERGLFHKIRIVFVDGEIYPRHCIFSDNWCVHATDRERVMLGDEQLREKEQAFLQNFDNTLTASQRQALLTMQQRLGLDLWGMDCAINDDGQIILFEANACMNFHDQDYGPHNEFEYLKPFQQAVRRAIKKMILRH